MADDLNPPILPVPTPVPVPVGTKQGVLAGIAQLLLVVMPFLTFMRLLTVPLPPWGAQMVDSYGLGIVLLGLIVAGLWRYFPPALFAGFVLAQQQQASYLSIIVYNLRAMTAESGPLHKLEENQHTLLQGQAIMMERFSGNRIDRMFEMQSLILEKIAELEARSEQQAKGYDLENVRERLHHREPEEQKE